MSLTVMTDFDAALHDNRICIEINRFATDFQALIRYLIYINEPLKLQARIGLRDVDRERYLACSQCPPMKRDMKNSFPMDVT